MAQVSQTIHGVTIKCITFPQRFIKEALHAGGFDIHDNEVIRIKQKGNVIVWLHTKTKARKARDCFYGLVIEGHKKLFADFYKDGSAPCPPRDIGVQNVSMKRVQEKIRELVMDHDAARDQIKEASQVKEESALTTPPPKAPKEEADASIKQERDSSPDSFADVDTKVGIKRGLSPEGSQNASKRQRTK